MSTKESRSTAGRTGHDSSANETCAADHLLTTSEEIILTYGRDSKGRKMAVLTRGGHPQIDDSRTCEVLSVELCKTLAEAKAWRRKMLAERPWETRQ